MNVLEELLLEARRLLPALPSGSEGFVPHDPNQRGYMLIAEDGKWWMPRKLVWSDFKSINKLTEIK